MNDLNFNIYILDNNPKHHEFIFKWFK